jgi:hypothetical protein
MLQRTFPPGFIARCLPTKTDKLSGLREIKHDASASSPAYEKSSVLLGAIAIGRLLDESQGEGMDGHAARLRVPRRAPACAAVRREAEEDWNHGTA